MFSLPTIQKILIGIIFSIKRIFVLPSFDLSIDKVTECCDWSVWKGIISFILFIFLSAISGLAVFFFVGPSEALNMENPVTLIVMTIASTVGLLGACLYAFRKGGSEVFRWGKFSRERTMVAIMLILPALIFGYFWSFFYESMGGEIAPQAFVEGFLKTPSITAFLVAGAYGVIIAPIFEEVLFRGFIQPAMVNRFGRIGGIFLASGIFGLAHIADPWAVVPTAVIGGIAGWLRYRTGSLGTSIIFHGAYNLCVFIIMANSI